MAHDDDVTGTDPAPAETGATGKGKGKGHPGHGLLNGPHRDEILILATVVMVGISYLTLRKMSGASSSTATGTAPGLVSSTNPTGAVAGYDQATMQGFQQMLQNQSDALGQLEATLTPSAGVTPSTPSPFRASTLFGPAMTGNYVRYANGLIAEVESDGSQLNLNPSEWASVRSRFGSKLSLDQLSGNQKPGAVASVGTNLSRVPNGAPTPVTTA